MSSFAKITALRSWRPWLIGLGLIGFFPGLVRGQTSYRGFYAGSISSGAQVAFYANSNNDVTVIVVDANTHTFGANTSVKISSTGHFSGNYSIALITGDIAGDGSVRGNVAPLNYTLTAQRAPITGATQALAGFYQGWIFDPNNRMLAVGVMVSADGKFYMFLQDGTTVSDAGFGTIDARGIFSYTDGYGVVSSGSVITTAGGNALNGRYTKPGTGGFTFVVSRRDAANRFVNISTRSRVGTGDDVLAAGFVINGGAKTVLIRGVGPTLVNYGVKPAEALADPQLAVNAGSVTIATNDNWSSNTNASEIVDTAARLGAFALPAGSTDAVLLLRLEPGVYSAVVSGVGGTTGIGLVEIYEVE